jgi:hypothetical protein
MHPYFLKRGYIMKAIVVYPGKPPSMHLEEVPMPKVKDNQVFVLGNRVQVAEVFAKNGFLVLSSVTGGEKKVEVDVDKINRASCLATK